MAAAVSAERDGVAVRWGRGIFDLGRDDGAGARVYDKTRAFVDIAGSVGDPDGGREAAELCPRHPSQKRGLVREIGVVIV
jgi:hypothetical protein